MSNYDLTAETIDAEEVSLLLGVESAKRVIELARLGNIPRPIDFDARSPKWPAAEIEKYQWLVQARRGRKPRQISVIPPFKSERAALAALEQYGPFDATCNPHGRHSFRISFSPGLEPWRKIAALRKQFPAVEFGYFEIGAEPWDYQRLADPVDPMLAAQGSVA